jgi:hypothetical protein
VLSNILIIPLKQRLIWQAMQQGKEILALFLFDKDDVCSGSGVWS